MHAQTHVAPESTPVPPRRHQPQHQQQQHRVVALLCVALRCSGRPLTGGLAYMRPAEVIKYTAAANRTGAVRYLSSRARYPASARYPAGGRCPAKARYSSEARYPAGARYSSEARYPVGARYSSEARYPSTARYPAGVRYPAEARCLGPSLEAAAPRSSPGKRSWHRVMIMECSISHFVARSLFAMGGTSLFSCPIGLQYSLASRRKAIFALCRVLSSDNRKGYFGGNGPSNRHGRQSVFLESSVHDRKHLRLRQTHNRLKETQEKLKLTQQRMKESKRRIMEDIRDTKSLMKERMENIIERENIWTVPNVLCVTRIVFSPYLGYLIIQSDFSLALGLLAVAGVTDALDGWIARTWKHQSSKLGSFLDPMADKVLIATLFLSLTYVELIPMALTALIILRDVTLVGAGFFIRYQSLPPPRTFHRYFDATHATAQLAPTTISKVNTMIQLLLVASTLGAPVFDYVDHPLLLSLCILTAGTTVASALSYIFSKDTYKILKRKNK